MSVISLSAQEAKDKIQSEDIVILDVRTPDEYSRGHLAGSKLLPLDQIDLQADKILKDKNRAVLVYCLSGSRSAVASQILESKGYQTIYNLSHGLMEWRIKQFPLEN
jgi:rhodanese-related sulfurtransferase